MTAAGDNRVAWLSCYPAHYMRLFHRRIEERFPAELDFTYFGSQMAERSYETGALPIASRTLSGTCSPWEVANLLMRLNPRAIIVAGHSPLPLLHSALWGFANHRPVLYWADTNIHNVLSKNVFAQRIRRLLFGMFFKKMYRLLYPGTRTREFYSWACGQGVETGKLIWMPLPETASRTGDWCAARDNGDVFRVLYLGRVDAEKGVDRLVKAFAAIPLALRKDSRLCIAGDGPELAGIERLVDDLHLEGVVELPGVIPSDATHRVFRDASIFVLPSNREAWGLVVNEALASGLPVVAPYWVGATADLIVDGQTGIILRDNSPEEIARAIAFFLENPESAVRMGQAGRRLVEQGCWNLQGAIDAFAGILAALPHRA